MGYAPGYGDVAVDYFKNLPKGTVTSGGNQRVPAERKYDKYGIPVVPGSPLRREPNLDMYQQPAYEGGMEKLMELLNREGDTSGLIGQGESSLMNLLKGVDPAETEKMFTEKYLPSQRRVFEKETIPGIREAMVGAGDFWSTGRGSLEADAQNQFSERMGSQLADLQRENRQSAQSALSNVGDISGMRQRQEMDRIKTMLPFLNLPTQTSYLEPRNDSGYRRDGGSGSGGVGVGGDSGRMIGEGGRGGTGNIPGLKFKMPSGIKKWGEVTGRPRMMM